MKIFVIGSASAVWGFALTGVLGKVVEGADELNAALDEVLQAEDIGIILITADVIGLARERIETLMIRAEVPLVVEIPAPEGVVSRGTSPDRPRLSEMLRRTIGVKI
jgi:vacuolar-type H+-ATPase subunit F/Vma7